MARYQYRSSAYKEVRGKRRLKLLATAFSILILALITWVIVDYVRQERVDNTVQTTEVRSTIQAESLKVFRTQYFQFQARDSWVEIAGEFTENKYVYRSFRDKLIEHDLTVYVNVVPSQLEGIHVQPVIVEDGSRLLANGPISEHCSTVLPKDARKVLTEVVQAGVTYSCRVDGVTFVALVGEVGDDPLFDLKRADGTVARYVIVYRDLTVSPDGRQLKDIASSFHAL